MNIEQLKLLGIGTREIPTCFLYHKEFRYVPIIRFEEVIVWDDNQISRTDPPMQVFELATYGEFDLDKPIYIRLSAQEVESLLVKTEKDSL
jgi:hypothetical protein